MAVNGGKRPGAGRKAGGSNKATILRQVKRQKVIAAMIDSGKPLGLTVLQKAMEFAEGAVANYRPTMAKELAGGAVANADGNHEEFGKWFDRWFKCIETITKYQTPQMKAIEAPTAAPDAQGQQLIEYKPEVFVDGRRVA